MCILFIALGQHPKFPLVITANRDEYHARPSQPLHRWQDVKGIWAGRDVQAGGTWLGVNESGQFAAVTNYRSATTPSPDAHSRGALVVKALTETKPGENSTEDSSTFDHYLDHNHQRYNPFNLVFGDINRLQIWDYHAGARRDLDPGFHSISNGPIDDVWPKMAHGVEEVASLISRQGDLAPDKLRMMMQDTTKAPIDQLPATGIDLDKEQMLSSIFIRGAEYGTRTTTILLFGISDIFLSETNYSADGAITSSSQHTLTI